MGGIRKATPGNLRAVKINQFMCTFNRRTISRNQVEKISACVNDMYIFIYIYIYINI